MRNQVNVHELHLLIRLVLDSTGIRVRINHGLKLHPGISIGINSAEPKSESESIPPMKDRFRPHMLQSGLFAPNTFGRCYFLQLWTILQQCLLPEVTFIQTFDVFYGWGCHGPRPMESKRNRFRSRKSGQSFQSFQSFLVKRNRNRNRFHMAMLYWNRNRNQLQLFRAESESIPVSWNQGCARLIFSG